MPPLVLAKFKGIAALVECPVCAGSGQTITEWKVAGSVEEICRKCHGEGLDRPAALEDLALLLTPLLSS